MKFDEALVGILSKLATERDIVVSVDSISAVVAADGTVDVKGDKAKVSLKRESEYDD